MNLSGHQAAVSIPAFIYTQGTRLCSWKKCNFSHIGHYGINLTESSVANEMVGCSFYDLGAGAIKIGSTQVASNGKNKILQCHIYNGGILFHSAVAILVCKSSNNLLSGNHIHDFYYSGISVGWTWGYGDKPEASGNIIENNHIHHLGKKSNGDGPILNDKGGIYTLGIQPGTIIKGNLIHDISAYNFGACGIYLDEGSSNILVEKNLVYDVNGYSFNLHYGRDNIVRSNIFAFAKIAQVLYSRGEQDRTSFTFERNIIYWSNGQLLAGDWSRINFVSDRNIYWKVKDANIKFTDLSWEEWQNKGVDRKSQIIDPQFVSPSKRDFRLKVNSPALKIGFKHTTRI